MLNGSTNADRTNYWEVVPTDALELALWMESDRMGYLLPGADRGQVREPARRRAERAAPELREPPVRAGADGDRRGAVPAGSSVSLADDRRRRRPRGGARSTTCARSSGRYYHPRNASLALAGDIDAGRGARAGGAVLRRDRRRARRRPRCRGAARRSPARARLLLEDRVELPRLYLAWHSPALFAPDDAELDLRGRRARRAARRRGCTARLVYERRARDRRRGRRRTRASSAASSRSSRPPRRGARSPSSSEAIARELERLAPTGPTRGRDGARPGAGRGAVRATGCRRSAASAASPIS